MRWVTHTPCAPVLRVPELCKRRLQQLVFLDAATIKYCVSFRAGMAQLAGKPLLLGSQTSSR